MRRELIVSDRIGQQPRVRAVGREIAIIAGRQQGVVAHRQIASLGMSTRQIHQAVQAGRLHPVHRGVYAVGHTQLSQTGIWLAAVFAGGDGSALSHLSGCANWNLTDKAPPLPHITTPTRRGQRPGIVIHFGRLAADEVTVRNGIPTTTAIRTIADVASVVDRNRLERIVAEAEFHRLVTPDALEMAVKRYSGRRGMKDLRAVVESRLPSKGITRSELEACFLRFLDRYDLARPELNRPLMLGSDQVFVDCLWRRERVVVELDGRAAHMRAATFESDRLRDRRLTVVGWRPMRVTWRQLHDEDVALARDLRAVLLTSRTHG